MLILKQAASLGSYIRDCKIKGQTVGFVPTMGALHNGHISLVKQSKTACTITVCSIFVNPTQFNDPKDFEKYPITVENDILLLEKVGADVLFLPAVSEVYPHGLTSTQHYNLGYLETILEGFYRPGHFQGVCQVVHRLLEIVMPDVIFMGRKDYQQCMVVAKMISLQNLPVTMRMGDTLREADGLAMSSRNLRLTTASRQKATAIYQVLSHIKENIHSTPLRELKQQAENMLLGAGFSKVDYVEICDAATLLPVAEITGQTGLLALVAAFLDGVRLIDNMAVG